MRRHIVPLLLISNFLKAEITITGFCIVGGIRKNYTAKLDHQQHCTIPADADNIGLDIKLSNPTDNDLDHGFYSEKDHYTVTCTIRKSETILEEIQFLGRWTMRNSYFNGAKKISFAITALGS